MTNEAVRRHAQPEPQADSAGSVRCPELGAKYCQVAGEGIRRIFAEMRRHGLTDPLYSQGEAAVRLTLSAADAVPDELRRELGIGALRTLDALRLAARALGTGQVADLANVSRPTALRHLQTLQEHGLVVWEGESVKDPRATWRVRDGGVVTGSYCQAATVKRCGSRSCQ